MTVGVFYEYSAQTIVGGNWLRIVVEGLQGAAFVVATYLTEKLKTGDPLWLIN